MNNNKVAAWGLIVSLSIAVLTGMGMFNEEAYPVAGLGMFIFGIWAAVILLKKN